VKERCRCVYADMPVSHLHKQIVIHMVYFGQTMMNAFPAAKGISDRFSPREIVLGRPLDAERDLKARFGDYVEASVDADVTNDIKGRTHPCIALGPSGNWQGSVKCFDLGTGKVVVRRTIKVLPMPDRVLKALNAWGKSPKNLAYRTRTSWNSSTGINRSMTGIMRSWTLMKVKLNQMSQWPTLASLRRSQE